MYGNPVGPAGRESVGEGVAVFREPTAGKRDGTVFRQRVGVEEHPRFAFQTVLYV